MGYQLGVDLGTTFTAAAVANGQPPTVLGLGNRTMQVPSVLYLQPDGDFLVGESAERRGAIDPQRVAREFKRRIGDPVPILIAGTSHTPQALTARLLRWVVDAAAAQMGEEPESITVSHPAVWTGYRHGLLEEVISIANIGPARTCPEPLAAAVQYSSRTRIPVGARIAVYDLGGGTFDCCLLEKTEDKFRILGVPKGIEYLGGIDFDELVFNHVLAGLGDRAVGLDLESVEATAGVTRLQRDCVEAKEALSSDTETVIPVALPGLSTTVRLTRPELESLIRPALMRTLDAMNRTLLSADIGPSDLTAIVLIGGSSRIPLVTEILQSAYETPTAIDTHPKHDVALGAVQVFREQPAAEAITDPTLVAETGPRRRPAVRLPRAQAEAETRRKPEVSPESQASTGSPRSMDSPATAPKPVTLPEPSGAQVAAPIVPPTARPATPDPPREPPIRSGKRRVIWVAAAGVGIAALVTTIIVGLGGSDRSGPAAGGAAPTPGESSQTVELPESSALTENQILVPMRVDGNWDVYLADSGSGEPVRRLTDDPGQDVLPVLSPRRRTVAFLHDEAGGERSLMVAGAADGSAPRPLWDVIPDVCAHAIYRIAWNPSDENQIALVCQDARESYGLYLFTLDGTMVRQYEVGVARIGDAGFSHDGASIAYWGSPASSFDGGELFTVATDGSGEPKKLTTATLAGQDADPVWSSVDDRIVFRRRVPDGTTGGNFDLYAVNRDGTGLKPVVTGEADDQDPSFSPFGDRLAFKSNRANTEGSRQQEMARIWISASDGTDPRPLWTAKGMGEQSAPAWTRR